MTRIKHYTEQIDDELAGAKEYAENYVECKSKNDMAMAQKYKGMAEDELRHAMIIHDKAVKDIEELEKTYKPTEQMRNRWEQSHKFYVEETAMIKYMLAM